VIAIITTVVCYEVRQYFKNRNLTEKLKHRKPFIFVPFPEIFNEVIKTSKKFEEENHRKGTKIHLGNKEWQKLRDWFEAEEKAHLENTLNGWNLAPNIYKCFSKDKPDSIYGLLIVWTDKESEMRVE